MNLIVCLDDNNGLQFNHRRQSRDRVVLEKIIDLTARSRLWMSHRTFQLFSEITAPQINIDENFLSETGPEEYCFLEDRLIGGFQNWVERIYVFRWNRIYPADLFFDLDLSQWTMECQEEFVGSSHEKITLEVYRK